MSIYDFKVKKRNGEELSLSENKGKVMLIVNTATGCGFTPQYEGLEILDFPCDQFSHQAPGTDDEIHEFCTMKYDTKFDQMSKIEVNGDNELPLYTYLKKEMPTEEVQGLKNKMAMKAIKKISNTCQKEGDIVWNFTKFLIGRKGSVIKRYDPTFNPKDMEEEILKLLEEK